ncbi:MAG: YqeG family HAD IIIA-type phosphatase [Bacillota bacterium]|nr:YqeG family HAD IIIA-type phosphatase [Bacillota bacterium]
MSKFFPDLMVKDIYSLPLEELKARGIRCLLFDVDNTIVPYNSQGLTQETIDWFRIPKEHGFLMSILSNNSDERVLPVSEKIGIPFVARAKKPSSNGAKRAMAMLGVTPEETAMVGDQLITDVFGGNCMGFYTIVVQPINKNEFWGTRINRKLEKIIYAMMRLKRRN